MGYRNNPIYISISKNEDFPQKIDLCLCVNKLISDYRHSVPLVREILFEFLQGKYVYPYLKNYLYLENENSYFNNEGSFEWRACKVTDNYLCSEYFLDMWCHDYKIDVFECDTYDKCCDDTNICSVFSSILDEGWGIHYDPCFFCCTTDNEKYIGELKKIIELVVKKANRDLIYATKPFYMDCHKEAYCSPDVDDVGLNVIDWDYFGTQARFDKYPLFLFNDEKGLSLATSSDCQYAALNRLLDGAVYRGLSEHFDISLELDMVSEAVLEFAGETDRCYRDGNSLIIRQIDDCMFSDFLRTYTIDTLFYPKGIWGEKKENPLFKLSFSPMGLNANLIANFEMYDKSSIDVIKSVITDIAEKYKRTLYFDTKPPLTKMPDAVTNKPREQLDIILNGKSYNNLNRKEKRLKKEHDRIMKLRNGESLPLSIWERIRAFLTK